MAHVQFLLLTSVSQSRFFRFFLFCFGGDDTPRHLIGLVGKPSAGKSTFFNAATAFSRQRGQEGDSEYGGASMAAHPFTTIDPNIGYVCTCVLGYNI